MKTKILIVEDDPHILLGLEEILKKAQDELKHLTTVERTKISKEIEVARVHGDLRENDE